MEEIPRTPASGEALLALLGPQFDRLPREEAAALGREKDSELFFEGLLVLGGRQQQSGNIVAAAAIYQSAGACPFPSIAKRARSRLAALSGQGSVGGRAEILVSQFGKQATDYRMIVPMIAGSSLFQLSRAVTLESLAGSSLWFSRGLAARTAANLGGFAVEVPAFSLLSRSLMDLSGEPVTWSGKAVGRDLAGAALTLGALKSFAFAGNQATARLPQLDRFSRAAIPQASAFSGMLLAHHVEAELGLRPKTDGATAVAETLGALASLGAGAHLAKGLLGPKFAAWEAGLRWRTPASPAFSPIPLEAGAPRAFATAGGSPRRLPIWEMSTPKDGEPGEPFYVSLGRIRGNAETREAPAQPTDMPFRTLVHRNNLYGGRVLALTFEKPEKVYTLGVKNSVGRQYKNLHESASGKPDMTLVNQRDGSLHHRQRVQNDSERSPDFLDLFRNEGIRDQQAALELRNGRLFLRNLTREPLVWVHEKSKWQAVGQQGISLQEGSWIVFGKDPTKLPENTLDPKKHSVLRVELHRPWALGPERWSLIEFERRDPDQLEKLPTPKAYLAALLGQSPDFIGWRFDPLFEAAQAGDWQLPELKQLVYRVFSESPFLAELNLGLLAEVLNAAQRSGWSKPELRALFFDEALAGKTGMGFLSRLPKLLEAGAAFEVKPAELGELLRRIAKQEGKFFRSLETLPDFLRQWQSIAGEKPAWPRLLDFLDQSRISVDLLAELFPKIPGGETHFLEAMSRLIPEIEDRHGYRGGTTTELAVEILQRVAERSPALPAREWVNGALAALPTALEKLFKAGHAYQEQRRILLKTAEEQGPNFARWWETAELQTKSGIPTTGFLGLGLGLLGLHELSPDLLSTVSPAFLLGASIFFKDGTPVKEMSLGFAWRNRLKAAFSWGFEKIRRQRELGLAMEHAGYFREALERFESAVDLAERHLESLQPRGPDNRIAAGTAHREAAWAYFNLAEFWRSRDGTHSPRALENYQMALRRIESLGHKTSMDLRLIERSRLGLYRLHLAEAEHWQRMGELYRAGENFEGAAEAADTFEVGIALLQRASRSYARAEPARYEDFARVIHKINDWKARMPMGRR